VTDSIAVAGSQPRSASPGRLACRIRPAAGAGARGPLPGVGEVELANLSADVVEIGYQMSPLQYLELVVVGPAGAVVSEGRFGDRFSPMRGEQVLRLRPGEKFRADVPLLGTVPRAKRSPGVYRVQAVYEYGDMRGVSDAVEITL
jgi:hypothetical protein